MIRINNVHTLVLAGLLASAAPAQAQIQQNQQDSNFRNPSLQQTQQYEPAQLDQVMRNPAQFMGRPLSIEGQVDTIFGPHSFLLESDVPGPNPTIFVISHVPYSQVIGPLERSRTVRLNGHLHQYTQADFEREYKHLIVPELQAELTSRPIFLIGVEEHGQSLVGSARRVPDAPVQKVMTTIDLADLMEAPQNYYGDSVSVLGKVDEIESNHAFVLKDETALKRYEILVVSFKPFSEVLPTLAKDQEVRVPGVLQKLTVGMFRWDREQFGVNEDVWDDFREKPILVIGMPSDR